MCQSNQTLRCFTIHVWLKHTRIVRMVHSYHIYRLWEEELWSTHWVTQLWSLLLYVACFHACRLLPLFNFTVAQFLHLYLHHLSSGALVILLLLLSPQLGLVSFFDRLDMESLDGLLTPSHSPPPGTSFSSFTSSFLFSGSNSHRCCIHLALWMQTSKWSISSSSGFRVLVCAKKIFIANMQCTFVIMLEWTVFMAMRIANDLE